MRVLVTGATGCVGTAVVTALRARGDDVVALVRPRSRTDALYRAGVTLVNGDVTDEASVRRAMVGCETVVHAAGRVGDGGDPAAFARVNVEGTRCVLAAAVAAGARVVHVSSTVVYGDAGVPEVTEGTPRKRSGFAYADSKVAAEEAVETAIRAHGLHATVVRPPIVYGANDRRFLPAIARRLRTRTFVYTSDPATKVNVVDVSHLAEVIVTLLGRTDLAGECFNVSDGAPPTLREVIAIAASHLRTPVPTLVLPESVSRTAATVLEGAWRIARRDDAPPLTHGAIAAQARDYVLSIAKAARVLGWTPHASAAEGLARACEAMG